jgi:hypothetical protein
VGTDAFVRPAGQSPAVCRDPDLRFNRRDAGSGRLCPEIFVMRRAALSPSSASAIHPPHQPCHPGIGPAARASTFVPACAALSTVKHVLFYRQEPRGILIPASSHVAGETCDGFRRRRELTPVPSFAGSGEVSTRKCGDSRLGCPAGQSPAVCRDPDRRPIVRDHRFSD